MFTRTVTVFDETVKGKVSRQEFVSLFNKLRGGSYCADLEDFRLEQGDAESSSITTLESVNGVGLTSYIITTFSVDEEVRIIRSKSLFRAAAYVRIVNRSLAEDFVQVFVDENKAKQAFEATLLAHSKA